ncbi:MAG: TetR family transcriptional regulator [Microbacterium sp. SCN 70-27]|uniref:TetR/AcrR family transcriptional regulator n=1 Tax=unclassified Microbacterium TaxID=2609290 RepID=UPI00086A295B|nr:MULTISPECIES: TetR/AcrR family transcriptional regulator [unclassified Microbacterium]MBN9225599.1 TetR family transcriptional regulator [Microbacterium sp.]ODT28073.1 MAG: TetR family transcriptional regulator [Microbacterium sp. SCN 70-27]
MTVDATQTPARRGRPGYDRDQVLTVAVQLFNDQGYDATSVADLAAKLGVTKSALYHHVDSKESILQTALDDALSSLEGALDDAVHEHDDAIGRLRQVVRGAVGVLAQKLPQVTLLLRVRGNSEIERAALERRRAFDHRVTAIVRDAQSEGALADDIDAAVATRLIFGMVNSLTEWYRPGGPVTPDRLADDVLRIALDGLDRVPEGA